MLSVKDLSLLTGKKVNLELKKGHAYVLQGPNGSGKSVLLRTLAGLYPATAQEFTFNGADVRSLRMDDYRSRVLYTGTMTHLPGDLTSEKFLESPLLLKVYSGFRTEFPFHEYLVKWDLAGKKLSVLSSGQKQLLVFLRAMMLRPELLLLDEPTSHLDRDRTAEVEKILREWKTPERSYLVVSHSDEQSARLGEMISFSSLIS